MVAGTRVLLGSLLLVFRVYLDPFGSSSFSDAMLLRLGLFCRWFSGSLPFLFALLGWLWSIDLPLLIPVCVGWFPWLVGLAIGGFFQSGSARNSWWLHCGFLADSITDFSLES